MDQEGKRQMNHHDEKGKISPAKSLVAKSMRARKEHKIEKVKARQPEIKGDEWHNVEKSGGYRKAVARSMKSMHKRHPAWARKG